MQNDIESYANWLKRGVEYTSDGISLKVEGSYWTGRERIWVDDELIVDRRTYGFKTEHEFVHDGDRFQVSLMMKNMLTGDLLIEAERNGEVLFSDRKMLYSMRQFVAIAILAAAVGYGLGYLTGMVIG